MFTKSYIAQQEQEATISLGIQQGQDDVRSDQQSGKLLYMHCN